MKCSLLIFLPSNICNPINEQWKLRDMVTTYREENGTTFIEKRDFTEKQEGQNDTDI